MTLRGNILTFCSCYITPDLYHWLLPSQPGRLDRPVWVQPVIVPSFSPSYLLLQAGNTQQATFSDVICHFYNPNININHSFWTNGSYLQSGMEAALNESEHTQNSSISVREDIADIFLNPHLYAISQVVKGVLLYHIFLKPTVSLLIECMNDSNSAKFFM